MQFNIKVRTTIAWQKAQHQKYSSTTIGYWKTHTVFAYLTSGAHWSSFGSLQLSSVLVFFAPKDDDDVLSFFLSVNSFLENPMHLPWVCCCSTGILQRPTFLSTTFDSRCSTWSHTSCNWYFHHDKIEEASIITVEDGSIGKWRWEQQQLKMGSIITMEDGSISNWRWQHQQHTTWASRQTQEEAGSISSNPNPLDVGPRVPRSGLQSSLTLVGLLCWQPSSSLFFAYISFPRLTEQVFLSLICI